MRNPVLCAAVLALFAAPATVALGDKPAAKKPAGDRPAAKKAAGDKPAARTPAAELEALQFLAGNFNCKATWYPAGGAEGQPRTARIKSKWSLGNSFLTFDYTQSKPGPIVGSGYWGYDADLKKYVHGAINSVGMSFMLTGDKEGDGVVFKGEGKTRSGGRGAVVFTFKKSDKGFTLTVEDTGPDGKLGKSAEETCTK